ncbi:hypothetical protein WMF31_20635 [Sorangium sp. So ce1036]|uniref:hypothetical protein n=1 Tax=Sorangium sp. So ce1036 TaxID=3133328 RepID=UPI003F070795
MLLATGVMSLVGCQGEPPDGQGAGGNAGDSGSSSSGQGGNSEVFTPDKVDLLLVVDNSGSMADKQEVLGLVLSDLVLGITNPPCEDASGRLASLQPASGMDECPDGTGRARAPVTDMHIGVISSSLGGHGAKTCSGMVGMTPDIYRRAEIDMAHLLARRAPGEEGALPTYQGQGFLAWDPGGKREPAGESDPDVLVQTLKDIVVGAGQGGCGYEAPLESFYRFLVDPMPYASISVTEDGIATPEGLDAPLLQQRAAFLRPDSLLLIVMLTDENDCSIVDGGLHWRVAHVSQRMSRARSECAIDPDDPCCMSCSAAPGECPPDPTCEGDDGQVATLRPEDDRVNLRCFDQKRRFGVDFLYPVERYVEALTSATITARDGEIVPNPIFSGPDPSGGDSRGRRPEHVLFTGIVGVPWQDIARDPSDLSAGLKTAAELAAPLPGGGTTWDVILGEPERAIPPKDPLMLESTAPRSGVNPITGDPTAPPGSITNPINGSEYTTETRGNGDLQYACVFPLPEPRICDEESSSCDCAAADNDSPVCEVNPDGGGRTLQVRAKAYPGLRELDLMRRLGDRAIPASICPAQLDDATRADYGYRPTVRAILDRLSAVLRPGRSAP